MRWLVTLLMAVAALSIAAGCDDGREGNLCSDPGDCDEGFVCLSQVYNCQDEECLGTCERECVDPTECEGGEVCVWVRTVRVCRPTEYEEP